MKSLTPLLLTVALASLVGCQTHKDTGAYPPVNTTVNNLESNAKFVLMDKGAQQSITSPGLQERILPDGRLEVVAMVRNRENRRIQVQIDCVFKDEQGFPTNDEAPFQNIMLTENATEAVKFTSLNNQARTYTIRVRQAR